MRKATGIWRQFTGPVEVLKEFHARLEDKRSVRVSIIKFSIEQHAYTVRLRVEVVNGDQPVYTTALSSRATGYQLFGLSALT